MVPALVPVAITVWLMLLPEPADAPLAPVCVTVQLKFVPPTLLVRVIVATPPEHKVCELGVTVTTGVGLTVTLTVCAVPAQLPAVEVGVTV